MLDIGKPQFLRDHSPRCGAYFSQPGNACAAHDPAGPVVMSQRANPLAVGLFFTAAIVLLVGVLFFFGAGDLFRKSERFVLDSDGSITGLKVGAPVTFQGVQVGQVVDIRLSLSSDNEAIVIPVLIDINRKKFIEFADNDDNIRARMIERGLRGQLKLQSVLTSLAIRN